MTTYVLICMIFIGMAIIYHGLILIILRRVTKIRDVEMHSNGNDNEYIEEMMNVLDNKLGYTNTILLVLEGSVPRFSNSLYAMLRQMTSIFGETWWDFMMIGVRYM